ncbi:xylitol ABC transporter, ATP-binding domain protein [Serratia marcescens]|nr:xylitol ABC transporter, ATP-binding domain protein [Serratia marcescens]
MSDPIIIQTRNVSRLYPGVTALDSVSYQVFRNQVNVLIGENGAGKSTMMKLLAGWKPRPPAPSSWRGKR